jgi:hypothetical protein
VSDNQIALIVSASSATIAVCSFLWTIGWSIWQYRQLHRPRLTVIATEALPTFPGAPWCVSVTVVNDGGVAVTITGIKFVVRNDSQRRNLFPFDWLHTEPKSIPLKLDRGERWLGLTPQPPLVEVLKEHFGQQSKFKMWVIATDAADRQYRSKLNIHVG